MPFFGLFSKKDKSQNQQRQQHSSRPRSTSARSDAYSQSTTEEDGYVLPPIRPPSSLACDPETLSMASAKSNNNLSATSPISPVITNGSTLRLVSDNRPRPPVMDRSRTDPLSPPTRRSSLFNELDDTGKIGTQHYIKTSASLPPAPLPRPQYPRAMPTSQSARVPLVQSIPASPSYTSEKSTSPTKRPSLFGWPSSRKKSFSDSRSVKSSDSSSTRVSDKNQSFNLKSFRHVAPPPKIPPVPPLPKFQSLSAVAPSSARTPVPPRTSTVTPTPGFQVTSRRPRDGSQVSLLDNSPTQTVTAGAFRQAARRSSSSLVLADNPSTTDLSLPPPPPRMSEDGRGTPLARPPARTPIPPSSYRDSWDSSSDRARSPSRKRTPKPSPVPASSSPNRRSTGLPMPDPRHMRQPAHTAATGSPRRRSIAIAPESSSSSSSEEENSDQDSATGVQRESTITQKNASGMQRMSRASRSEVGHGRSGTPVQSRPTSWHRSESGHDAPALPPSSFTRAPESYPAPDMQRKSPVYSRPRASLSTSALSSAASRTRQSTLAAVNARASDIKGKDRAAWADSDTSADEDSSSEDDAPLSNLVTKRPASKMSLVSTSTAASRQAPAAKSKTLVDLAAPSSFETAEKNRYQKKAPVKRNSSVRSTRSAEDLRENAEPQQSGILRPSQRRDGGNIPTRQPRLSQSGRPATVVIPSGSHSVISTSSANQRPGNSGRQSSASLAIAPPTRMFRESPASSSNGGDSSSGVLPLTPRDGSDIGISRKVVVPPPTRPSHRKRASVTFAPAPDELNKNASANPVAQPVSLSPEEIKRRERRRSEAKNAIELGNVMNGPGPIADSDEEESADQIGMQPYMQSNVSWNDWATHAMMNPMATGMMQSPQPYMMPPPPPDADMNFMMAHQQAMMIAKQTYQMAVAQQAMAAAAEEWDRSSNVGGGGGSVMGWNGGGSMFPPAPRSMYGGSVYGGGGGGGGGGGWGSSSVYGENFGPSMARNSMMMLQSMPGMASTSTAQSVSGGGARPQLRQRTKTAPSNSTGGGAGPPILQNGSQAPPSSWKRK